MSEWHVPRWWRFFWASPALVKRWSGAPTMKPGMYFEVPSGRAYNVLWWPPIKVSVYPGNEG